MKSTNLESDVTVQGLAEAAAAAPSQVSSPPLGSHLSIAGGLENAFFEGQRLGCDCLQVFVKNQRQWNAPPLGDDQRDRFRAAAAETGIRPVMPHASYLLNLASPDPAVRRRSLRALVEELTRCEALGIEGLVLHPGAHLGAGERAGLRRIATGLRGAMSATPGFATRILLETTAGQGSSLGYRFEHLSAVLRGVAEPERLGVCLDTCHLFAAGYDIRTPEGYFATIAELDRHVGLSRVRCIHMNDSKRGLGERVDRHEHIGRGCIGRKGFAHFLCDPRWRRIPMILETPKGKDGRGRDLDRINLKRLRTLVK